MTDEDRQLGRDRLIEIYADGMLSGESSTVPPSFADLEAAACETLDERIFGFAAGGAGGGRSVGANATAFDEWQIVPRMLRDVSTRDLAVELFGQEWRAPIALAPIGVQSLYHEDAEVATAKAARDCELPFVLSTVASTPLEAVAEAASETPLWFQLYWSSNRELTASLVERAEAAGYGAIVVTVDSPIIGWRERDVANGYFPFLAGEGVGNYFSDPVFRNLLDAPPEDEPDAALMTFLDVYGDASLTWSDLDWLRARTDLPIVVKGLLHPADAEQAVEHGADGIVVSNHGGRQIDRSVSALGMLPSVVDRLDDTVPVLFDSGIRRGADVVIALALGADAVQLGRPYIYGLALEGEAGVRTVCRNLLADLDLTLGLSGHAAVGAVDRETIVQAAAVPAVDGERGT